MTGRGPPQLRVCQVSPVEEWCGARLLLLLVEMSSYSTAA